MKGETGMLGNCVMWSRNTLQRNRLKTKEQKSVPADFGGVDHHNEANTATKQVPEMFGFPGARGSGACTAQSGKCARACV